ncbi:flavin-containing monooxygenase [Nocardioides sambongensis]|uniref:flavin-containing monooxygenase n=1 Tax=Nocardioides sambongensis TaxID=2589074 RepID=UPI001E440709|nr:NAD(P)/FAD-dependent oxidoreductase [Nocardioides sambongensis]
MTGSPRVVVIGAGFGGLAAAVELLRRGHDDLVLLERADEVGGVWRENTYPGAACDVPSPFYSYSFRPNPRWPHRFSRQPAILDYLRTVAEEYDVRRRIRFGAEVVAARYDEDDRIWRIVLADGEEIEADVLVSAVGQLSRPAFPALPGREEFAGPSFHSAQWRHDVDLSGRRVAVVGTGASAVQFVPAIVDRVGHMAVFQRSAPYLLLRPDRAFSRLHHRVFERLPLTQRAERGAWYGMVELLSVAWVYSRLVALVLTLCSRLHMRWGARSAPGLLDRIWPDYPMGCKRVLFSNDYVPALARPHVDVVTDPITRITPTGVVVTGEDGQERQHEVDVLIWGTGFKATEFLVPLRITGRDGRDLHQEWADGAHAYFGMTVPGFPGLHIMYGPNTNTGGGSIVYFLEVQARYLADLVDETVRRGAPLDVRSDVARRHDARIQRQLADSVWTRCDSWYRVGGTGRITTNWPLLGAQYRQQARFDARDYEAVSR